ncbi:unnamed protein product [Nezara viridula]|uniref:Peroxisomal membrane protein PEX14 n=1 Tax=Nezara viridula TaxID=85310 RepID=A0A9P0ECV7_NEZVI|nr:unnamed protein product [Nezara viridula]
MSSEENNNDPNSIANKPPVPPRDELVKKAADFLSMHNVQKSPEDMKIAFLKKKGLSDVEIDLAFKKCELMLQNKNLEYNRSFHPPSTLGYPYQQVALPPHQKWLKFRDIANGIVLLAGVLYGLYWFYKRFLWRHLFGNRDCKKPSTEERLSDMESKLSQICHNLDSLKDNIENKSTVVKEIQEVKFEVSSLKKLLLNRKQFPVVANTSASLSIPAWQIAGTTEEKDEEGAATNGSDSSLEMIKE